MSLKIVPVAPIIIIIIIIIITSLPLRQSDASIGLRQDNAW